MFSNRRLLRPTGEDILRAVGYAAVFSWGLLFLIFPPLAYISELDFLTRLFWVGTCMLGAFTAFLGAIFRIDLKMELPGVAVMLFGPLVYTSATIWFILNPPPSTIDPTARFSFVVYAALPIFMTLPRMYSLYNETQRSKSIRRELVSQSKKGAGQ